MLRSLRPAMLLCTAMLLLLAAGNARTAHDESSASTAALEQIDRLLVAGRAQAADSVAQSQLQAQRGTSESDRHAQFVFLDSLVSNLVRRTYQSLALQYGTRLMALAEGEIPGDSPEMARLLRRHSKLRISLGDADGGRADATRAVAIARKTPAIPPAELADFIETLANMPDGDYSSAELYAECLRLRSDAFGPISYPVARTHVGFANVSRGTGDYALALIEIQKAIEIAEQALPAEDPRLLGIYNTYGAILGLLHDEERCNQTFRRCVRLAEKNYGLYHLDTARYMNNVGVNAYYRGHYDEARAYHDSALAIRLKIGDLGGVNESRRNLGMVAWRSGRTDEAVSLLTGCLPRTSDELMKSFWIADVLGPLGQLHLERGELAKADSLLALEQNVRSKFMRPEHPGSIEAGYRQARLEFARGDARAALTVALDAAEREREHFALIARTLPERMVLDYVDSRPLPVDLAFSLPESAFTDVTRERLWDVVIRNRGRVLEEMAARNREASGAADPALQATMRRLARSRSRLGSALARVAPADASRDSAILALRRDIETLESTLAERSLAFRQDRVWQQLGFDAVRRAMPDSASLVAFSVYRHFRARHDPARRDSLPHYAALVLASRTAAPEIVEIGSCSHVDSLVTAWRAAIARTSPDAARRQRAGERLRRAVWDPIAARLGDPDRVFLVPDGVLALVNFDALPIGSSAYLVERGPLLHVLASERDVAAPVTASKLGDGLLVVAAPDFDAEPRPRSVEVAAAVAVNPAGGRAWRSAAGCRRLADSRFEPLRAAGLEGTEVVAAWRKVGTGPVELLAGAEAGEAEFKLRAPGYRVLHLATHGFFVGPGCDVRFEMRANPLHLSGLAFAGANRQGLEIRADEDGILTSEEIATLDLGSVDWVVLSACNTGVGDVRPGEGVFGLRRAFAIAGTRSTLMSLWPVEDWAARQWMSELYAAKFARGLSTAEAVRAAERMILNRLRRRGMDPDPAVWAAFLHAGSWQ